jgi:hypothetical protein
VVQHNPPGCCHWCLFSLTAASTCRACLWFFLPSPCRSFTSHGNPHYNYYSFSEHSPSWFAKTYEHKLSLLENADEAISPWSRCFSLRWWLSVVSSILYFLQLCWFFLYHQPFLSSLEATGSNLFWVLCSLLSPWMCCISW